MTPMREPVRSLLGGCEAEAAGGLDDHLHALGEEAHAVDQLDVADLDDVVDQALDDREGELAQVLVLSAVGDGLGVPMRMMWPARKDWLPSLPASGSTP